MRPALHFAIFFLALCAAATARAAPADPRASTLAPLDVPRKEMVVHGAASAQTRVDGIDIYSRTGVGEAIPAAPAAAYGYGAACMAESASIVQPYYSPPGTVEHWPPAQPAAPAHDAATYSSMNDSERMGVGEYVPSDYNYAGPNYDPAPYAPVTPYGAAAAGAPIALQPGAGAPATQSNFTFNRKPTAWEAGAFNVMAPPANPTGAAPITAGGFTFVPRNAVGSPADPDLANGYPRNYYDGPIKAMHPQLYWYNDAARRAGRTRAGAVTH